MKTTSKKVTWLSADEKFVPVQLHEFDYLFIKDKLEAGDELEMFLNQNTRVVTYDMADCNVAELKENDVFQFDRKGFFRVDRTINQDGFGVIAFRIPTGKGTR